MSGPFFRSFPRVYLKQLVCFKLLCAEHDAVSVTSNSDGLAALTEQHHVLTVFTVEPMGNACYCAHTHTHAKEEGKKRKMKLLFFFF